MPLLLRSARCALDTPPPWPARSVPPPAGMPPRADGSGLSIVIAACNQWRYTDQCLASVIAEAPRAEVIVVDNGSSDQTAVELRRRPVRVIRFHENRGVAPAYNAGLALATGRVIGILNNDTVIRPGGLRRLAAAAWECGIAAHVGAILDPDTMAFRSYTTRAGDADYADGCCCLYRRDVYDAVGGYDEGYRLAYCEDTDWSLRASAASYGWAIVPDALTHYGQRTSRDLAGLADYQRSNHQRLVERWARAGVGYRIRVRRWGAMGDVVMATPVLRALRQRYPLAKIALECSPPIEELMRGLDSADLVTHYEYGGYTHAINLDGAYERRQSAGEWMHPTDAFAAEAGVAVAGGYDVPAHEELDEWARAMLPDGRRYLACGIRSACRPKQTWRGDWAALADALPDWTLAPLDAEPQPDLGRGREFYCRPNVLDVTGQTPDMAHLYALIRRCHACVTVDTGVGHLAAAAGLPVVGMYTDPRESRWARPGTVRRIAYEGSLACLPCHSPSNCAREDGRHCLDHVSPAMLARAVRRIAP